MRSADIERNRFIPPAAQAKHEEKMKYTEYITRENDRWDLISYKHYGTTRLYEEIIKSNPRVNPLPILPSGIKLKIPALEINSTIQFEIPPWRE